MIAIRFLASSPLHSALAQMDFGPTIDFICPVVGFALLIGLLIGLAIHVHARRKKIVRFPGELFIFGLLFLVWLPFQIENYFFEPHYDDVTGSGPVEDLPEVQRYMKSGEAAGTQKTIQYIETKARPGLPFHSAQYAVGDARDGHAFEVSNVWHIFGVDLVSGHVSVWVGDNSGHWVPVDQWRRIPHD